MSSPSRHALRRTVTSWDGPTIAFYPWVLRRVRFRRRFPRLVVEGDVGCSAFREQGDNMTRVGTAVRLVALLLCSPIAARADVVLDWNTIAMSTLTGQGQNPFAQARFMSITQLAVFEAVNAITGDYKPYLGTVVAPAGASVDAAAATAAYAVLKNYFPLAPN